MKKIKLWHAPRSIILRPLGMLPIFIWLSYTGFALHNYALAFGSMVVWLLVVLFAINYWFQALISLIGSIVALYFRVWWLSIVLVLLFLYMVNAAKLVDRGDLDFSSPREKLPLKSQIIEFWHDKKEVAWAIIVFTFTSAITCLLIFGDRLFR
jgi:hypothetical protein